MGRSYRGQTVVITGASDGIGAELARRLAPEGPHLVLAARGAAALEAVAATCRGLGAQVTVQATDVADAAQCQRLIEVAAQAGGGIDVLVNNVGVSTHAPLAEAVDSGLFEQVLRVNVMGSVWCTRYALPQLLARRGQIVAVCSLAGRLGIAQRSAYCASKFAQDGFFQALRAELRGSGVAVSLIYPGFVATGFAAHSLDAHGQPYGKAVVTPARAMSVAECAGRILAAMRARRPETVLTGVGRVALWLKLLAPTAVDRLTGRTVQRAKQRAPA
jgi:short-subunit dehydrogenase